MNARLAERIEKLFASRGGRLAEQVGELTLTLPREGMLEALRFLRDDYDLRFEQLIDLCGVDYSAWAGGETWPHRFAVVYHLLSVSKNQRLRVRIFAEDDAWPMVDSVVSLWPSANWYEREAFDLFGIVFQGHPDLRRILTDYGFVGHPFRKDFPLTGHVEMRYDPDRQRVVYEPVSIEAREITPRVVREETFRG